MRAKAPRKLNVDKFSPRGLMIQVLGFILTSLNFFYTDAVFANDENRWIDYTKYGHSLMLKSFRGGVHDEDGENEYYFQLKMIAKPLNVDGNKKMEVDRKSGKKGDKKVDKKAPETITEEISSNLKLTVKALSPMDESSEKIIAKIGGDAIRSIVAKAMQKFKLTEPRVRLEFEVLLLEQNKSLGWFGNDVEISKGSYSPFGALGVSMIDPVEVAFTLQDDKGLFLEVVADYRKNTEENAEE